MGPLAAGDPNRTTGNPTYYSKRGDPRYRIRCTKPWGRCEVQGRRVPVPSRAIPAGGWGGGGDAHMTIVDQHTGWEYDLWDVTSKRHHRIYAGWGGRTRIGGTGLGSAATAAHFGNLAGIIRAQELRAGIIRHALVFVVPCVHRGGVSYPSRGAGGEGCKRVGLPRRTAPRLGAHFQLAMSQRGIRRLHLPRWQRAIVEALRRYGAYVVDTTGARGSWGVEPEHAATYTSFGHRDEMDALAGRPGVTEGRDESSGFPQLRLTLSSRIPWHKLRVVRPCVARRHCR
jgi:hypothetical protein